MYVIYDTYDAIIVIYMYSTFFSFDLDFYCLNYKYIRYYKEI